jgi:hypothetical protein
LIVAAFPTDAVLEDLPILTAAETYMDSVAQQKPSFLDEVVRERDEARSQIREELRKASRPALVMNVLYQRMIERELQEHSARGRRATERDLVETLDSLQMQLSGHFGVAADKVTYSQATFTRHLLLRPNAIAGLRDLSESELAAAVIDAQVHAGGDPISSDHILRIRAAWANAAPAPWLRRLATR